MPHQVLWVEEEPRSLRYEHKKAAQWGWEITFAYTASTASELMQDTSFALVVVDLILPKDDFHLKRGHVDPDAGLELIESIRDPSRIGSTPCDVPLLIVTAVVSPSVKDRVLKHLSAEHHYLAKPIPDQAFLDVLAELTSILDQADSPGSKQ